MAAVLFVMLWFVAQNLNEAALGYEVVFRFSIGHWFARYSPPIPVGFVFIVSF